MPANVRWDLIQRLTVNLCCNILDSVLQGKKFHTNLPVEMVTICCVESSLGCLDSKLQAK